MAITLDGTTGSTQPSVAMSGATSGTVTLTPPAVAGTQGYTLPSALPTASGQALTATTAGVMSWAAASASPAGSNTQIQFNNSSAFGGSANLVWDGTYVGVGTSSPSTYADTTPGITTYNSTAGGRSGIVMGSNATATDDLMGYVACFNSNSSNTNYRMGSMRFLRGSDANSAYMSWFTANSGAPAERMRLDASGNLGIGTTAPAKKLDVSGDASINSLTVGRGGGNQNTSVAVGYLALVASNTNGYITALGHYALNLATGADNLGVGAQAGRSITTGSSNVVVGGAAGYYPTALDTGTGNTCIGQNACTSANNSVNQSVIGNGATGKGNNTAFIGGSSGAYNGANTTTWATTSDQRIKKNVVNVGESLDKINALRVVEFNYKENDKHETGFIAQEFQQVFPEQIVTHDPNEAEKEWVGEDKVLAIQQNLVPFLVKAIQELTARVAALEAK